MKTFIKDLFHPIRAFHRKSIEYTSQFKKVYEERTDAEKIVIEALYNIEFIKIQDAGRYLGAIECILMLDNRLEAGKSFNDYKISKKESYKSMIVRLAKVYLTDKNIL